MFSPLPAHFYPNWTALFLSLTGVIVLFLLESHVGLSLWDEGYLWYGAQRVMLGEVPIRDFMAYDIGRYYWSAAWMSVWGGKGIVALRFAIAIFQIIALYIGLAALARTTTRQSFWFWLFATLVLLTWFAPQFRSFDIALPIILVGTLSFLIEQPTVRRYFLTGVVLGVVAIFGRNHGVYGVAATLGVMAYLSIRHEGGINLLTSARYGLLGIVVGYLPMLLFLVAVPDFALAFWDSIRVLFEAGATNFPLPIPWPWLVPVGEISAMETLRGVLLGTLFITIVAFGLLGIVWAIRKKLKGEPIPSTLIATIFLTLPYAHYAYSRADIEHFSVSAPPLLLGVLVWLTMWPVKFKWPLSLLFFATSLVVMLPGHYLWNCYAVNKCVEVQILGDRLKVDLKMASNFMTLTKLSEQFAPEERTFMAVPTWPGAYALFEKKSPMWGIFLLLTPPSIADQQAEIERIKIADPGFVLIDDLKLNGRDEMRFRNTHPLVDQYIRDNFVPLNLGNPTIRVYKSKLAE